MLIDLFTVEDNVLVPSVHCYSLKALKEIMDVFPKQEDYLRVYLYIFYKTCSDPKTNPFFNLPEEDKDELILQQVKFNFSTDESVITEAIKVCEKLYDTPTKRAYKGMKTMMDKLAKFFENQALSTGRDGSLTAMVQAAGKYQEMRESFKGVEKDYLEEIAQVRGQAFTAYDMR